MLLLMKLNEAADGAHVALLSSIIIKTLSLTILQDRLWIIQRP